MCLLIHPDATSSVAEHDIEVYKVVHRHPAGVYYSPFMSHKYSIGGSYTSLLDVPKEAVAAFTYDQNPSFDTQYPETIKTVDNEKFYGSIEVGLHSFASLEEAKGFCSRSDAILRCVIPAGSLFYKGAWGYYAGKDVSNANVRVESYASSALKVIEEIIKEVKENV